MLRKVKSPILWPKIMLFEGNDAQKFIFFASCLYVYAERKSKVILDFAL